MYAESLRDSLHVSQQHTSGDAWETWSPAEEGNTAGCWIHVAIEPHICTETEKGLNVQCPLMPHV